MMKMNKLLLSLAIAAMMFVGGCPSTNKPLPHDSTPVVGESIVRAQTRNQAAKESIAQAKPHADEIGKEQLVTADTHLTKQNDDLKEAKSSLSTVQSERTQLEGQLKTSQTNYDTLDGKWYVRYGKKIEHLYHIALIALGIGLALRVLSMFVSGPFGTIASFASTGIFGIFSGGLSLVQAAFDNLHFRGLSPASKKQTQPTTEVK